MDEAKIVIAGLRDIQTQLQYGEETVWACDRLGRAIDLIERLQPKPMTLEEAVKIMNTREIGDVEWRAEQGVASLFIHGKRHRVDSLGKFIAKAVAEKILREKKEAE